MYRLHRTNHSAYDLQRDLTNIKNALTHATHDVRGRIGEIIAQSMLDIKEKSLDAKDSVSNYIVEKPFKSIGFSLLFGFILGLFLRKK